MQDEIRQRIRNAKFKNNDIKDIINGIHGDTEERPYVAPY